MGVLPPDYHLLHRLLKRKRSDGAILAHRTLFFTLSPRAELIASVRRREGDEWNLWAETAEFGRWGGGIMVLCVCFVFVVSRSWLRRRVG